MQRRPTSFDIAALAGVSQPTVSRALSGNPSVSAETRARVLAAAEQLNYKVDKNASNLRRQHSHTLALLFFEEPSADGALINPFYLSMLGPMVRCCATRGYDLLISFQQLSSDWHVDYEDSRKADGIILLGYGDYREHRPRLMQLLERGTHFVRWGPADKSSIGPTIGSDNVQGGFDATEHLILQGRRRIAFIGTATPAYPELLGRWRGYCKALQKHGIEADVGLRADAEPDEAEGRAAVADLMSRGVTFDAIFAASDFIAAGTCDELAARGIEVPGDVALVGFDDAPIASAHRPALSSIRQDGAAAGRAWGEAIVSLVEQRGDDFARQLPVELIVRESSG